MQKHVSLQFWMKNYVLWISNVQAGRRRQKFTFWLTFFLRYMLPLFFSGLLLYLIEMKKRTRRHVACKRDNIHFLRYVLISPDVRGSPFVYFFSKLYVTFILQWIAFVFGRDKEERTNRHVALVFNRVIIFNWLWFCILRKVIYLLPAVWQCFYRMVTL